MVKRRNGTNGGTSTELFGLQELAKQQVEDAIEIGALGRKKKRALVMEE